MPNTPVPAAGEAMPAVEERKIIGRFSRRALLGGAIAAVPAIGTATAASLRNSAVSAPTLPASPVSPILAAYRQWDALYEQAFIGPDLGEDEVDRLLDAMGAIVDGIEGTRATTATELLAKSMMMSSFGTFTIVDADADALCTEARAVLS
jgi:hypothetical protein